jgi:pyruvate-formate lyase
MAEPRILIRGLVQGFLSHVLTHAKITTLSEERLVDAAEEPGAFAV